MMRNKWIAVVALAVAACGGDAGEDTTHENDAPATTPAPQQQPTAQAPAGQPPQGATPEMVTQGQQVFSGKGMCLTCHGPTGTGTPLAPNLTDAEWINISGQDWNEIQTVVRNGVPTPKQHPSPMPPMGGAQLSDQEIQAVAAYVYSISHQGS